MLLVLVIDIKPEIQEHLVTALMLNGKDLEDA